MADVSPLEVHASTGRFRGNLFIWHETYYAPLIYSDGSTRVYTYYGCTGGKDRRCKNPYIREESVITQLCEIVDKLDIDKLGARHLIDKEIARYNKLRKNVLGSKEKDTGVAMDIKKYAKYLLEEGSMEEKRELLEHLRGKLVINDKKITLSRE